MDRLDKIERALRLLAKSHVEADRQRAKDKAEADRQRAKDKEEADRQRAKDKEEADRRTAEADRQRAKDKEEADRRTAEADRQRAKDKEEDDRRAAEADRRAAEADQRAAQADRRAAQADRRAAQADKRSAKADKRSAKADKERAELRLQMEKTAVQHKNTEILVGHMNNRFGDLAESMLVGDVIEALKKVKALDLEQAYFNAKSFTDTKVECEIDALLIGRDSVVVMEAKSKLTKSKVDNFVNNTLTLFTKYFPEFTNKKIYGAVGYLKAEKDATELAIAKGLLVVRSALQAKEVVNPEKFQPKDYNPNH